MMKRIFLTLLYCSVLCIAASSANADMITYDYALAADDTLTTTHSWATVDTFDSDRPGWTYSGYGKIRSGSEIGRYAAPYNSSIMAAPDSTNFFAVPEDKAVGLTADISFGGNQYNYLGLFWGSADGYNTIEFYNKDMLVATYSGDDVLDPANGDQYSSSTNSYVNFYLTQNFDTVRLISTEYAFELDNLAVGMHHTPVPGAVFLGLIGLGIAGRKLRRYA
jgi:hypothetical protein